MNAVKTHAARVREAARHPVRTVKTAGRTCRYLWAVRAAVPWPVKVILAVAMVLKCMPADFLMDETLTAIAVLILQKTRPGLMKACYRAAQIRA